MNSNLQAALPKVDNLNFLSQVLLNGVVAVGESVSIDTRLYKHFSVFIKLVGNAASATVVTYGLAPTGAWVALDTRVATDATNIVVQFDGPFEQLKVGVTVWAAGQVHVGLSAQK